MWYLRKSKSRASSRLQININGVTDGVLILPDYKYRAILHVSSVNFDLISEEEKDGLIELYEGFLNSISYDLQLLVRIRELDIEKYLTNLNELMDDEKVQIYKLQIKNYVEFLREIVKDNKILKRNFYVVVPYDDSKAKDVDIIKEQLNLRCDIVSKNLAKLGINSKQLDSLDVLDLFYSFYNPRLAKVQPLYDQVISGLHNSYIQREK